MRGRPILFVVSLALACGNDEDVGGGSGASQSSQPDGTTTTGEPPTKAFTPLAMSCRSLSDISARSVRVSTITGFSKKSFRA